MSHALRLKVMFIVSLAIIVVGGAIYMVTDLYIEKQHFEEKWNKQMYQSIEVMSTLQDVKAYMGFGGFIHHYKNYLLRRDANYLILMRESGHNLEQAIEDLREAFLRGEDDKNAPHFQALNALKQNYFNYLEKSELLAKYIHEGKSVAEMDQLVRIDDDVAIRALDFLDKYSLEHHHDILSDIQNEVDHIENLAKLGIFIVPLIILLAVLLIRSLLRLDKSSRDARFARDAMVRLINAAPDALIVVNRDGQFVRFNDSAPKLFGYSGDELAGLQLEDLLPAELRASHTGLRKSFFDEPKVRGMASRLNIWAHHSSGRAFPIEVSLSYMNEGSETLAVALVYDISDRVRFEQSKEEFVSIMAHELRTPVTAINGALSMIQ
ncbi:MAG: PAS domain S-box protein, partial [Gammaproteobacteria bacterium]|nr:PAS domain S-box protein [Gammaproteobacteria bacterium]